MSQNAYEPPATTSSPELDSKVFPGAVALIATIGSLFLVLVGCAVAFAGTFAADGSNFFFASGACLVSGGVLGITSIWVRNGGGPDRLLRATRLLVNAGIVVYVGILIATGTILGPLVIAAPILICVPAGLNVLSAVLRFVRG